MQSFRCASAVGILRHASRKHFSGFEFLLLDNILGNLATNIIGTTTLIPDFIRHLTRSEIFIGIASSLFEVGSTKLANHIGALWFFVHSYNAALSV